MSEHASRSLRPRKPHPYLPPDTQDPDQARYARLNYTKETVSPAMELNYNAKVLVKFLNSMNKCLRQCRRNQEQEEPMQGKPEHFIVDKQTYKMKNAKQMSQRNDSLKKLQKEDPNKKEKQYNNFKNPYHPSNLPKTTAKNQLPPQRYKYDESRSYHPPNMLYPLSHSPALLPQLNSKTIMMDPKIFASLIQPPQNPMEASQRALAQRKILLNQAQFYQAKKSAQQSMSSQKDNKIFGRSAYHVAIAYHIHLKKLKENGQHLTSSESLDPTYCARKLRGQKGKSEDGMIEEK